MEKSERRSIIRVYTKDRMTPDFVFQADEMVEMVESGILSIRSKPSADRVLRYHIPLENVSYWKVTSEEEDE